MSASTSPNTNKGRTYKIVILGDGGVGKSALVMQFVCHRFLNYHDPTIEDAYQQQARIDGEAAQLDILDTAGQPEFTAMRDQYMRKGEGFMICYDITDRRSFEEALEYKKLVDRVRNRDDIPVVLVGNKCDLAQNRKENEVEDQDCEGIPQIGVEEGQDLANQWDCPFFETSAALRHFVDDAFHGLIREIRRREREVLAAIEKQNRKKNRAKQLQNFFTKLNVFKR